MKKIILFVLVAFLASDAIAQNDFITVWRTPVIRFAFESTGPVNYSWSTSGSSGGGVLNNSPAYIVMPSGYNNSNITLIISPTNLKRFFMVDSSTLLNGTSGIKDIQQWGDVEWSSMKDAFRNCDQLDMSAIDVPNLSQVTSMERMFQQCPSLIGNISINNWNTSTVTNMAGLFQDATQFNQPINNWNTSNVTNMSGMFWVFGTTTNFFSYFNQPIGNWDVSNVINMSNMFNVATSFNQPIGNWNTNNVTNMSNMFYGATSFNQPIGNWNTINVTNISNMFSFATNFNQPIGNWNTSNVTDMSGMFYYADFFNQPIENWNVSNVTNMSYMFTNATSFNQRLDSLPLNTNVKLYYLLNNSGVDCDNYSKTINGWANNPNIPIGRNLGATSMHFGINAQISRNYLINTKGWTINGDTMSNTACYPTQISTTNTQNLITISPNPTHSIFKIECSMNGDKVILYNSFGQKLLTSKIENQTSLLDISHFSKGIYIAEIIDDNTSYRVKIIKD